LVISHLLSKYLSIRKEVGIEEDHLSLVAGISRLQRKELDRHNVATVRDLATLHLPIPFKPDHAAVESYTRVREQARIQVAGRDSGTPTFELIDSEPERGLARLPELDPGDIYFATRSVFEKHYI